MSKNRGKRKNQAIMPCNCTMQVLVSYSAAMEAYVVKTAKLAHNHAVGEDEYKLYSSERRPESGLQSTAEALLSNGANPTLVTNFLNSHNVRAKPRDVYNMRQKLNFRGKSSCTFVAISMNCMSDKLTSSTAMAVFLA